MSGRKASNPASAVTPGRRNWTMRRRPESSLRTSPCDSPAGFALAASINNTQYADYYS